MSDFSGGSEYLAGALDMAEALELHDLTVRILNARGLAAVHTGRYEEARALYEGALAMAERYRLPDRSLLAGNSADLRVKRDMADAIAASNTAVASSRELGQRKFEDASLGNLMMALIWQGQWDEVERMGLEALAKAEGGDYEMEDVHYPLVFLSALRGDVAPARSHLAAIAPWGESDDAETRDIYLAVAGLLELAGGDLEKAVEVLREGVLDGLKTQGASADPARVAWGDAVETALALGRIELAEELVSALAAKPRGRVAPLLRAELARGTALLAAARGEHETVEESLTAAIEGFDELGYPYWRARAQIDLAVWLIDRERRPEATSLLDDAGAVLAELEAKPLLSRARELQASNQG